MTKASWKKKLIECCKTVGTYREEFLIKIDQAAQILEDRDEAYAEFVENGKRRTAMYTNKNGSTNEVKDPRYVVWRDACVSASSILSDLGLDPKSLKKLDEDAMKPKKKSGLAEVLNSLG